MRQQVALDRVARRRYFHVALSAVAAAAGCSTGPAPIAPAMLPPLSGAVVTEWVERYVPARPVKYDLRWTYETQQGRTRGRAAIRLVPPDSLRFDYRAPFGRSGAAVIIGDEVLWSKPEEEVGGLVAIAPLFWAALGIPRKPPEGALVSGQARSDSRVWRYTVGERALTYLATAQSSPALKADMVEAGRVLGTTDTKLARPDGPPLSSIMLFPSAAARFFMTVRVIDTLESVDPAIWKEP